MSSLQLTSVGLLSVSFCSEKLKVTFNASCLNLFAKKAFDIRMFDFTFRKDNGV